MYSFTVVGIVHSSGKYEGRDFDNYNLHCVRSADTDHSNESGQITSIIKVRSAEFLQSGVAVGDEITPYYDQYGRVVSLDK